MPPHLQHAAMDDLDSLRFGIVRGKTRQISNVQIVDVRARPVSPDANADIASPFEYLPVSPREFIDSQEYYGAKPGEIWPWIYEDIEEIFSGEGYSPKYNTVVEIAGIGSGKSTHTALVFGYLAYWIHCLRDPAEYYHLVAKSIIAFVNMAPAAHTAKKVVFDKVLKTINRTKIFEKRGWQCDPKIQSELRFPKKNINIVPGNSSATFTLSYDYFGGIIDEAGAFATADRDPCEELYDNLNQRRDSRFHDNGLILMIGSATTEGVFIERFVVDHQGDPKVMFRRRSRYKCNPYYFDKTTFQISVTMERKGRSELIELTPPLELENQYKSNLSKALRDIDGIPSFTMQPFYMIGDWTNVIDHLNRQRVDPFPDRGMDHEQKLLPVSPQDVIAGLPVDFRGEAGARYYCHVDLSKGDAAAGQCPAGFAMGHVETRVDGDTKAVVIDLSVRFIAQPGHMLHPKHVRELIYYLHAHRGFNIVSVTFDQYNSQESILEMIEHHVYSDRLAVGYEQHTMLKNMLTTGGVDIFYDENLMLELKAMEDKGIKVEPSFGNYMDEADAVAGAVYGALTDIDKGFAKPVKPRAKRGTTARRPGGGGGPPGAGGYRSGWNSTPLWRGGG